MIFSVLRGKRPFLHQCLWVAKGGAWGHFSQALMAEAGNQSLQTIPVPTQSCVLQRPALLRPLVFLDLGLFYTFSWCTSWLQWHPDADRRPLLNILRDLQYFWTLSSLTSPRRSCTNRSTGSWPGFWGFYQWMPKLSISLLYFFLNAWGSVLLLKHEQRIISKSRSTESQKMNVFTALDLIYSTSSLL